MQKYTKAIIAFVGVLLPFLEQVGVALPDFLTLDWVQGLVLALTPLGVFFFPNKDTSIDFQSVAGTHAVRSPVLIGLLAGLVALLMLSGCAGLGIQRPPITSIADGIAVTAADVETSAVLVKSLCLNVEPGGLCAIGAVISTATKDKFKASLQSILDGLRLADLALTSGDLLDAQDRLARTQALLAILRAELTQVET